MACLFGALYSYTADLFPTTVRSAIVGMCSTSGRLGGILAPVIADGVRYAVLAPVLLQYFTTFLGQGVLPSLTLHCFRGGQYSRWMRLPFIAGHGRSAATEKYRRSHFFFQTLKCFLGFCLIHGDFPVVLLIYVFFI